MKIGFVTFCTSDWTGMLNNLVDSVLNSSKYDITVFSINFNYEHENKRVKNVRVDIDDAGYFNVCKMKIYASFNNDYDIGLVLDCDMVATKEVDLIFEENYEKILNSKFPLCAKHPHNPFKNGNTWPTIIQVIRQYTENDPKMDYVYSSFLFSNENKWFLEEVYENLCNKPPIAGEDEYILNAFLTKYEVDYDIGYNYLPNATNENVECYLDGTLECKDLYETYLVNSCPVKFYLFHGHLLKNLTIGQSIVERIKNKE
jgi:hypothetical protein